MRNIGAARTATHHDLWIDPDDSEAHRDGNDGGGAVTYDVDAKHAGRGRDRTIRPAQFYHVVTTEHVPYHVCGAQQDNSTICVPSNTNLPAAAAAVAAAARRRAPATYSAGGGEPGYIAPDPQGPRRLLRRRATTARSSHV